ncbi:hypothetical protein QAD02_021364 [Eretmocerus hayati]|uniref:Uncharacterized protein n=1 Tax=Eretmocerus hayati TaxID=131215 RepID=A0ACC2PRX3_9HYME|nr:hypothetical protein QAD02_021364 [Eretmocerus hayati]
MSNGSYDIVAISETILAPSDLFDPYNISGYIFFCHVRAGKDGGGVGFHARSEFAVNILHQFESVLVNKLEYLIAEIKFKNMKMLFATVYRRPPATYPHDFMDALSPPLPLYEHTVVTGDFNINIWQQILLP